MIKEHPSQSKSPRESDTASTLNVLTYDHFKKLEDKIPDISRQFHKFVVRSLSFHMAQDCEAMQVLLV